MINNPRRKQTDPNLPKNKTLWFKFFVWNQSTNQNYMLKLLYAV
jgi:hypothetical protein